MAKNIPGTILIAADNGHYGTVVLASENKVNDVRIQAFTKTGGMDNGEHGIRYMDSFKLSYRYYLPDVIPDWVPLSVIEFAHNLKTE